MSYVEAAIVRIKLLNFVTYDNVEFRPGPHLNVIIGPNGTGKSTIVCAICLGLAGKTSFLGRAQNAQEFIKHGKASAVIELELHNPKGDNLVIRREITRTNNNWKVNGRNASQKAIEELVAARNIQIGNLCQFLPQDKVADFAKMSPQQLLENTEKAVGPPEMYENHQKLKNAREDGKNFEVQVNRIRERLEQEKTKNARLENDVKNYNARKGQLQEIKILKMKRPWLVYLNMKQEHEQIKQEKDEMAGNLRKAEAENQPLKNELQKVQQSINNIDKQLQEKHNELSQNAKKGADGSKNIEQLNEDMKQVEEDLSIQKGEETRRKKKKVPTATLR